MRRWDVLAKLITDHGLKSFAEIGTKEGRLTSFILEHCPDVQVYGCDPWMKQPPSLDPKAETYEEWDFDQIEAEFRARVEPWKERCHFARLTGDAFAKQFEEDALDCVFLDARHDYASVLEDISTWYTKVRPGGFITGHDFNHKWPGVQRAVADHFPLMQVIAAEDSVWIYEKPAR